MGTLVYDKGVTFRIDDRTLAHLQVVIITKLRRSESFALDIDDGVHIESIWVDPQIPLEFRYDGNRHPTLNHAWVEAIAEEAGLTSVMRILPEPRPDGNTLRLG